MITDIRLPKGGLLQLKKTKNQTVYKTDANRHISKVLFSEIMSIFTRLIFSLFQHVVM